MRSPALFLALPGILLIISACTPGAMSSKADGTFIINRNAARADDLLVVDCLLPGQLRKLGRSATYLTPRRPVKTAAYDCEIKGGEYTAYDRSSYATALKVWLPLAMEGDKAAQTYVGEIFEKGLGVPPDYALAAGWYKKAAEQGYARAQINLGYLYEKGLGVEKDPAEALGWYRRASGLKESISLDPGTINAKTERELDELRHEIDRRKQESESLQQQLEQTRMQLEKTREELKLRQHEADSKSLRLDETLEQLRLQKKHAESLPGEDELGWLEKQLKQRENDLKEKSGEIKKLNLKLEGLEEKAQRYISRLEEFKKQQEQVSLAGPSIEIIDPPLVATRGISIIKTKPGIERSVVGRVTAPAGLKAFTVNGQSEVIDEDGLFSVPVMVQGSDLTVKLVAVDRQGKRGIAEFQFSQAEPPKSGSDISKQYFGVYHALIIGNNKYTHWPVLSTPENDAVRIAKVLGGKYGFKTRVLLNATRADILHALNEFRKQLTEKDNFLVYYAGHGYLEEKINRGYWIPVDGEMDSDIEWIPTYAITDILGIMSARHVLVVSDSCYSGAFTRSALARLDAGMTDEARNEWIRIMFEKRSRNVFTSGDMQPVLDTGGGKHSVFARAFLDVLTQNRDILEGQRLYQEVAARVAYAAKAEMVEQVPQYAPLRFAGYESGDFFFVPSSTDLF